MSFFSRFTTGAKNLASAIYNAGVQAFQTAIGMPTEAQMIDPVVAPVNDTFEPEFGVIEEVDRLQNSEFFRQIKTAINGLSPFEKMVLKVDYIQNGIPRVKYYTLNNKTKARINRSISDFISGSDADIEELEIYDPVIELHKTQITGFEIIDPKSVSGNDLVGGVFKYKHNIDDEYVRDLLKSMEIFHRDDMININENCFITAISDQVSEETLMHIKRVVKGEFVKLRNLCTRSKEGVKQKGILETLGIYLQVWKIRNDGDVRKIHYNREGTTEVNICLIDEHYFKFIEDTKITKYYLENIEDLYEENTPYDIIGKTRAGKYSHLSNSKTKKGLSTYDLVKILVREKDTFLNEICAEEKLEWINEKFDGEYRPYLDISKYTRDLKKAPSGIKFDHWMTFDVETFNDDDKKTRPYLCCCSETDEIFYSMNMFCSWLASKYGVEYGKENKTKTVVLYAHNSTFDAVHLLPYIFRPEVCIKDGRYVFLKGLICRKGLKVCIIVKDSYRLIAEPLAKFGKIFKLDTEKEVMYYDMYNVKTITRPHGKNGKLNYSEVQNYIDKFNAVSLITDGEKKERQAKFWENIDKWGCRLSNGKIDILKYSAIYCLMDCEVLKKGIEKFRSLVLEINKEIDVHHFYSQSSIADWNLRLTGCYDGVKELNGVLGDYFQKAIVGGRCMLAENKPQMITEDMLGDDSISYVDAVSLYPSAMICGEGYPIGDPKMLEDLEPVDVMSKDYYVVTIKIKKIGVHRSFPLISYVPKGEGRWWTDELDDGVRNGVLRVDKYTLQDLIKFHKIEFDVIDGYYFDQGFNTKVCEVVDRMFKKRQKVKGKNKPLGDVYKLFLNAAYGKTIQKSIDKTSRLVPESDIVKYISNNYNSINYFVQSDSGHFFTVELYKSIVDSWSRPQCGGAILSRSKRIMNELICLAEDNDYPVYYQDTDSIHIKTSNIEQLKIKYKDMYNRDLMGKNANQFHPDFTVDVEGADEDSLVSKCFIGIGKKVYYDRVIGNTFDGVDINEDYRKMKGVSNHIVKHTADKNGWSMRELFERHYTGEAITYDLNAGGRIRFDKGKSQIYTAMTGEFNRKIQFKNGVDILGEFK